MKAVCVEGHLCADATHAEHESERLQIGMPAVSRVVRLVFESTQQPGAWVSEHDEDELPVCRRRNAYGAEEKTQEFPCELMYKIFVKAFFFFCQLQTRRDKLQKLIPAQPTKSTREKQKSWFHFWCSCGQNNFYSRNTKRKVLSRRCYRSQNIRSALTEVRQNFTLISRFFFFPYLKPPHVWPGHRSISRLGSYLSGVLAPHLRPKWWTRAKTWTSFFFYMCVTASSTRNKCVFLRDRNCRTVWNKN